MREGDKNNDNYIDIDEMIDIFLNDMDIEDKNSIEAIRNVNSLPHMFILKIKSKGKLTPCDLVTTFLKLPKNFLSSIIQKLNKKNQNLPS